MNMFPNMLEPYIERFKPALNDATLTVSAYAERVICRLEDIIDAIQSDETLNVRRTFPVVLSAGAGLIQEVTQVGTDQDWTLETITVDTDSATSIRIRDGRGGIVKWGKTFAGATVDTNGGNTLMFAGGSSIVVESTGGITQVYLQFRYERRQAPNQANRAGRSEQNPTAINSLEDTMRHVGMSRYGAGINVIGERHE